MQVATIDFQPVQPYYTQYFSLWVGELSSFNPILSTSDEEKVSDSMPLSANNTVGNYWLRALLMSCVTNDGKRRSECYNLVQRRPRLAPWHRSSSALCSCVGNGMLHTRDSSGRRCWLWSRVARYVNTGNHFNVFYSL